MNEYLVTVKATVPIFFGLFSQSRTEARAYIAKTAEEAVKKAHDQLEDEIRAAGIGCYYDAGDFTVLIVDVKKI